MVKKLILILLIICCSCTSIKNEYNQERYKISRFTIKPTENSFFYEVIDTSSIYILTEIYNNGSLNINIPQGLKFYKNGRVGKFKEFDLKFKEITNLNPKNAEMGLYKYHNNKLEIEFMSNSAQSGNFLTKKEVLIKGDTIISSYGSFEYKYVKKIISKDFLIYKPDW